MIYDLTQVTSVSYAATVPLAQHVLRMLPVDRTGQRVLFATVEVEPEPVETMDRIDFFGNRVLRVDIATPHRRLTVRSQARVRIDEPEPVLAADTPSWEEVRARALASSTLDSGSPVHFLFPSRLASADTDIGAYAQPSFPPGRPILEAATDLMRRIHRDFAYAPGSTDVRTSPAAAFRQRRGVCQDFAHIMIVAMRGLDLPCAYVSGCLRTYAPPGTQRLQGADATHAWVAVWCGDEVGWRGLDPTNDCAAAQDHIVLAVGRDYADVAPVNGIIVSSGDQAMHVGVDVVPVLAPAPARPED